MTFFLGHVLINEIYGLMVFTSLFSMSDCLTYIIVVISFGWAFAIINNIVFMHEIYFVFYWEFV